MSGLRTNRQILRRMANRHPTKGGSLGEQGREAACRRDRDTLTRSIARRTIEGGGEVPTDSVPPGLQCDRTGVELQQIALCEGRNGLWMLGLQQHEQELGRRQEQRGVAAMRQPTTHTYERDRCDNRPEWMARHDYREPCECRQLGHWMHHHVGLQRLGTHRMSRRWLEQAMRPWARMD